MSFFRITGRLATPWTLLSEKQRYRLSQYPLMQRMRRLIQPARLGTLRRVTPLSRHYGFDRGTPVDRYYIERFLEQHRADIHGHTLEVKDSTYTDRYGHGVYQRDVLDVDANNPHATLMADLATADHVAANQFDCFVLTQTLQMIYDTRAALAHAHRLLRPGGVLLATMPAVSRILPHEGIKVDYWRFTSASCAALFGNVFGAEQIRIRAYGNCLTGIAFLAGMASEELSQRELTTDDEYFPVIVGVRAVKR
jgi:hypothetical protein